MIKKPTFDLDTIEGLEELKKEMLRQKGIYTNPSTVNIIDWVIHMCDMRIHKLKKQGASK